MGIVRAYEMVYNAQGMNDELYDEFVEVLQWTTERRIRTTRRTSCKWHGC